MLKEINNIHDQIFKLFGKTGGAAVKNVLPILVSIVYKHSRINCSSEERQSVDRLKEIIKLFENDLLGEVTSTLRQIQVSHGENSILLYNTLTELQQVVDKTNNDTPSKLQSLLNILTGKDTYGIYNDSRLKGLLDSDYIGLLYEVLVGDKKNGAFSSQRGQFFTPKNIIISAREVVYQKFQKDNIDISNISVYDPCSGSARFIVYWLELIKEFLEDNNDDTNISELSQRNFFATDYEEEIAAYATLNMVLHGDGSSNVTRADALNHYGIFAHYKIIREFLEEFASRWEYIYNYCPNTQKIEIDFARNYIRENKNYLIELKENFPKVIDIFSTEIKVFIKVVHSIKLLVKEQELSLKGLNKISALINLVDLVPVSSLFNHFPEIKKNENGEVYWVDKSWKNMNNTVECGVDLVLSNPPFGRGGELNITEKDDSHILSQFKLANQVWLKDPNINNDYILGAAINYKVGIPFKENKKNILVRTISTFRESKFICNEDNILFTELPNKVIGNLLDKYNIENEPNLYEYLITSLKRDFIDEYDNIYFSDLTSSNLKELCTKNNLTKNGSKQVLVERLISAFDRNVITKEDMVLFSDLTKATLNQIILNNDLPNPSNKYSLLEFSLGRSTVSKSDEVSYNVLSTSRIKEILEIENLLIGKDFEEMLLKSEKYLILSSLQNNEIHNTCEAPVEEETDNDNDTSDEREIHSSEVLNYIETSINGFDESVDEDDSELDELSRIKKQFTNELNLLITKEIQEKVYTIIQRDWLKVDDIFEVDTYTSYKVLDSKLKIEHEFYFYNGGKNDGKPILFKKSLPKQILFLEQFLRVIKPGGLVFTVIDTGVLSNLDDEYVRRFLFTYGRVHGVFEFPHGAFKSTGTSVKTALILYERLETPDYLKDEEYSIFGSLPQNLGYNLNKQETPVIKENDLGKMLCDWSKYLRESTTSEGNSDWGRLGITEWLEKGKPIFEKIQSEIKVLNDKIEEIRQKENYNLSNLKRMESKVKDLESRLLSVLVESNIIDYEFTNISDKSCNPCIWETEGYCPFWMVRAKERGDEEFDYSIQDESEGGEEI